MNSRAILGILLLIVGIVLFIVGVNASDSFADQWSEFFTGTFTDRTMWLMIGGGVVALVGLAMLLISGRRWGRA